MSFLDFGWPNPFHSALVTIAAELKTLNRTLERIEKHMATLDTLSADLTPLTSAVQGTVTLLGTLAQEVRDLKTTQTDPATAAKIDALDASIQQNTRDLAAALAANTDSAAARSAGTGVTGSDTSAGTGAGGTAPTPGTEDPNTA